MKPKLLAPQFEALIQAINLQDDKLLSDLTKQYAKGVSAKNLLAVQKLRQQRKELMRAKVWVLDQQKFTFRQWLTLKLQAVKIMARIIWQNSAFRPARIVQK